MRIAIFTDTFLPSINGIVTSIVNSSTKLAKRGHRVIIFTSMAGGRNIFLHRNIRVERFKAMDLIDYPDFHLAVPHPKIIKKILEFKPDVIHSNMPSLLGWEAVICSSMFGIPLVGTYHTLLPDFLEYLKTPQFFNRSRIAKSITWKYTRLYYNRCDIVTAPSIAMKEELERHGIARPIRFLSNGVDLNHFRKRNKKKNGRTILHVGRISYEKNVDIVIKAFRMVLKKHPGAKLLIVGRGPDVENLKKLSGKDFGRSIRFLGPVENKKLPSIYSSADIFATASTIETEGLVILEAMGCGLPIVGVDALAIPDVVRNGKNGIIVKPRNPLEMAKSLNALLEDKRKREKFGNESLRLVKKFSLEKIISDLESMYCLLSKKRRPLWIYRPKAFSNSFI